MVAHQVESWRWHEGGEFLEQLVLRDVTISRVYEILCVNGLLCLGESPLKQNGKSIERCLPIADGHGPLLSDIL